MMELDDEFIHGMLLACYDKAIESDDKKTQNGAVLWNADENLWTRGTNKFATELTKYPNDSGKAKWMVHAEENAILSALTLGRQTAGSTLFCVWAPCTRCARMIVRAGVSCLITHKSMMDRTYPKYIQEVKDGLAMLAYAGVEHINWEGEIGGGVTNLMNGETWNP